MFCPYAPPTAPAPPPHSPAQSPPPGTAAPGSRRRSTSFRCRGMDRLRCRPAWSSTATIPQLAPASALGAFCFQTQRPDELRPHTLGCRRSSARDQHFPKPRTRLEVEICRKAGGPPPSYPKQQSLATTILPTVSHPLTLAVGANQ